MLVFTYAFVIFPVYLHPMNVFRWFVLIIGAISVAIEAYNSAVFSALECETNGFIYIYIYIYIATFIALQLNAFLTLYTGCTNLI